MSQKTYKANNSSFGSESENNFLLEVFHDPLVWEVLCSTVAYPVSRTRHILYSMVPVAFYLVIPQKIRTCRVCLVSLTGLSSAPGTCLANRRNSKMVVRIRIKKHMREIKTTCNATHSNYDTL